MHAPKSNKERAAVGMEYAVALALLLSVFIFGAALLQHVGVALRDNSMEVADDIVPCGMDLSGDQCH